MPDYKFGKLYIITSEKHKLLYVGSTAQKYISTRIQGHIGQHKHGIKKCKSIKLLECDDYEYKLLKDFPCSNIQQLKREEGSWILHYKKQPDYECVNKNIAGRTRKEYCEANRDRIREQQKEYCENNRDKILEDKKEWYNGNKDKRKEYLKKNKDKIREKKKEYYEKNQDKIKEQKKEYYENNKDKILAKMKQKYREPKNIN